MPAIDISKILKQMPGPVSFTTKPQLFYAENEGLNILGFKSTTDCGLKKVQAGITQFPKKLCAVLFWEEEEINLLPAA